MYDKELIEQYLGKYISPQTEEILRLVKNHQNKSKTELLLLYARTRVFNMELHNKIENLQLQLENKCFNMEDYLERAYSKR